MAIASVLFPRCQKVLPAVYDDSLSYYEQLCKLVKKLNEVIETFNSYEEVINELAALVVDIESIVANVNSLQSDMTDVQKHLEKLDADDKRTQEELRRLTDKINSLVNVYNSIIAYVDNAVSRVKIENQAEWIDFKQTVNSMIGQMQLEIDELRRLISELPVSVYNPVRGINVGFNKNNAFVYEDLRDGGLTNAERSEVGGTNEQLANKVLNNRDYAINGRFRCKMHWLFSPVSGKRTPHYNAISEAMGLVTNGLSNTEFAELDLTNDEVAALDLTNIDKFLYKP